MKMNKERLINEAIINDVFLQRLNHRRCELYLLVKPQVMIDGGEEVTIWYDEVNNPLIDKIDKLIEHRTNQIKDFYI